MKTIAGVARMLAIGIPLTYGCGHGDWLNRGLYEGAQVHHRSQEDPPHDAAPTYDQYQAFRKGTEDDTGNAASK